MFMVHVLMCLSDDQWLSLKPFSDLRLHILDTRSLATVVRGQIDRAEGREGSLVPEWFCDPQSSPQRIIWVPVAFLLLTSMCFPSIGHSGLPPAEKIYFKPPTPTKETTQTLPLVPHDEDARSAIQKW